MGRRVAAVLPAAGIGAVDPEPLADRIAELRGCICDDHGRPERARSGLVGLFEQLSGSATPRSLDGRVHEALRILRAQPGQTVSLGELGRRVGLSPSRLNVLFVRDVGIPVRRYVRWLRDMVALSHLIAGESVTRAALESGFADSAHLSRTHKQLFSYTPSEFAESADHPPARDSGPDSDERHSL
ncbi:MAG: AraC family transcriptional regulator, partial [Proteobacteria bacterium]|nr:AraC family transcriptional regulator [Pseudomonadota bacterium]